MMQQSHSWAYIQRRPQFKKIQAPEYSLQHYLGQPGHGSNENVHQQRNAPRRIGPCTQWNISHGKRGSTAI